MTSIEKRSRSVLLGKHLSKFWLAWFSFLFGVYVGLPFLAPLLMHLGLESPGRIIYGIYAFLCHQLPERSFFLFGSNTSYMPREIAAVWPTDGSFSVWRSFIGNEAMGWKVAWSDRMVSMFTSILVFAWLWWPLRRKIRPLHWKGFLLLLIPMAVDGATHLISDLFGLHSGFRSMNEWLALLTNRSLPASFYFGDALGSFNSWMRLVTGLFFGLAVVWFGFPHLERNFISEEQQ